MGEAAWAAERAAQHRWAKVVLPLLAAAAAVVGWAVGTVGNWQLGLVAALVVGLGVRRLYRRAHNSWAVGAAVEARTAKLLAPLVRRGHAVVLHDRAARERANPDHLVFTAAGAVYVETKNWTSDKSQLTVQGGTLRPATLQRRCMHTALYGAVGGRGTRRALGTPGTNVAQATLSQVGMPRTVERIDRFERVNIGVGAFAVHDSPVIRASVSCLVGCAAAARGNGCPAGHSFVDLRLGRSGPSAS
ncbi:NERD domain-containing protein [Streptomyces sp. NBC_00704]|uniref:nuclease-related domain-containing protein n=1 Tax=Streptomyces sp. NBC_00704 TaxID=2975809 RepID=UPI002E352161|nr:nuclease-related domain-containing protein [Streptomyces sp. NBC_00704]